MSKHTPGPWRVNKGRVYAYALGNDRDSEELGQHYYFTICPAQNSVLMRAGEPEANAALIAAAPDLLEALDKVLTWAETYKRQYEVGDDGPLSQDIEAARAAIAKAKQL